MWESLAKVSPDIQRGHHRYQIELINVTTQEQNVVKLNKLCEFIHFKETKKDQPNWLGNATIANQGCGGWSGGGGVFRTAVIPKNQNQKVGTASVLLGHNRKCPSDTCSTRPALIAQHNYNVSPWMMSVCPLLLYLSVLISRRVPPYQSGPSQGFFLVNGEFLPCSC